jgi:hypothetical protein
MYGNFLGCSGWKDCGERGLRGCLFDFNGIKSDLIYSSHSPTICDECKERLRTEKVSETFILQHKKKLISQGQRPWKKK